MKTYSHLLRLRSQMDDEGIWEIYRVLDIRVLVGFKKWDQLAKSVKSCYVEA